MAQGSAKLKEIVHYICRKKALHPEQLGAVKLHKILWYTDIRSYRITGETLTGASYKRMQQGPFANELNDVVTELAKEQKLTVREVEYFEYDKYEFVGKGTPDISMLEDRQIRWIDEQIDAICEGHTATSISEKTHDKMWQGAEMHESLPVSAAAIRFIEPGQEAIDWARSELGSN
ncbi:MAG: Panacea domain-containing protein [Thiotrichaceae bacterium]